MRTHSSDTSPEAERLQIELIRKAPITKLFALMEAKWNDILSIDYFMQREWRR